MKRTRLLGLAAMLPTLVLCLPWCLSAGEPEAKKFFRPDAPDMPAYTLPDVLTAADGRKIATADDWKKIRRPEILELFRKHVYGRVPATPYQKTFQGRQRGPQGDGRRGDAQAGRHHDCRRRQVADDPPRRFSSPTRRRSPSRRFC